MAVTITAGGTTLSPILVSGFESSRDAGTIEHRIIGGTLDLTLRPASPRRATLELLFPDEATSKAAEAALATAVQFTLTSEIPSASFVFVVSEGGSIRHLLDPVTRKRWTVQVDVTEVA